MLSADPQIADSSAPAHVFLTGVTGFVGKVALEELIRRRVELNLAKVYVLIRTKNSRQAQGLNASQRFKQEVASSPCFAQLPENWEHYVEVMAGDLSSPRLGLNESDYQKLQNNLTHIINCAASVEFNLPVADAAAANITSALNVLELGRDCPLLQRFVNVSTAYVSPHQGDHVPVPEALVALPFDPEQVYQSILAGTANATALMAQSGHPNTYTFTKCLSEHLLVKHKGSVPLAIVRPSIISASWQYPQPGWIDSYAAFAGFVSLIGSGLLKCVDAHENTSLDIVPCDEVVHRVLQTAFWPASQDLPLIQHAVSGLNQASRVDTCISAIESYFQRNPVHRWAKMKAFSDGRSIVWDHLWHHVLPTRAAQLVFRLTGKSKAHRQAGKLLAKIEDMNASFPYFTHKSFDFELSQPLSIAEFEPKQYVDLVCDGVYRHLMRRNPHETHLGGSEHQHPLFDLQWANTPVHGNWAIRTAAYIVKKGLRRCTDLISFDRTSFERALFQSQPNSLMVIVPNHRSYMDFLLCSYLFFAHPELRIKIPHIAAASDFARIPFLGWFFKQAHAFYIQRGRGGADPALTQKIQALVDQHQTLEFFIEGMRSRTRQFMKPRRGLLRALQSTGIPCTVLPISLNYDLVPEEKSFLRELHSGKKSSMKLSSLLRWGLRLVRGQVKLGRVHISCGQPIEMLPDSDAHQVSRAIMGELQAQTSVSHFHLRAFLQYHPLPDLSLEWLSDSICARGGLVIDSQLETSLVIDPLIERSLQYQWLHLFYDDLAALPDLHPVLAYHIRENQYLPARRLESAALSQGPQELSLLKTVFEPWVLAYQQVLNFAARDPKALAHADAKGIAAQLKLFLPCVEDALSTLMEAAILEPDDQGNGFMHGSRWDSHLELHDKAWAAVFLPTPKPSESTPRGTRSPL